nr:NADH dehydrogenase subunit 2 [Eysarcoris gibbosus]
MKKSTWLFIFLLIFSVLITISANNWISMWIGLELNMMSFIPLIMSNKTKYSSEASMMYFFVQSMSSTLLVMMVMCMMYNYSIKINMIKDLLTISLLIKLGAAPFHMWMPEMMSKMQWMSSATLMTWQKIAPMMMISNIYNNYYIINMSVMLSVIIGSVGGVNQVSLRKLMGYSSINHLGWMLAINKNINLWMSYIMIYSTLIIMMCYMFNNIKVYFLNQMNSMNFNETQKISLFILMMSMGGLPPLMGFLPKWITVQTMVNSEEYMMLMIMIMCSLITLMYYMRVMTKMFLTFSSSIKWSKTNYNPFMYMIMNMVNLSLPLIMIMDII